jgi:hypothetical protein
MSVDSDVISRAEAIKEIESIPTSYQVGVYTEAANGWEDRRASHVKHDALSAIASLPAVQPVAAGEEAMRRACIEKVRQLNQKQHGNTLYLNATQRFTVEEIIVALEAIEVKGENGNG